MNATLKPNAAAVVLYRTKSTNALAVAGFAFGSGWESW